MILDKLYKHINKDVYFIPRRKDNEINGLYWGEYLSEKNYFEDQMMNVLDFKLFCGDQGQIAQFLLNAIKRNLEEAKRLSTLANDFAYDYFYDGL